MYVNPCLPLLNCVFFVLVCLCVCVFVCLCVCTCVCVCVCMCYDGAPDFEGGKVAFTCTGSVGRAAALFSFSCPACPCVSTLPSVCVCMWVIKCGCVCMFVCVYMVIDVCLY